MASKPTLSQKTHKSWRRLRQEQKRRTYSSAAPVFSAVALGDVDAVVARMKPLPKGVKHADQLQSRKGFPLLHVAVRSSPDPVAMVTTLLEFGCSVNRYSRSGCTALCVAVSRGRWDVVDVLLAAGAQCGPEHASPLGGSGKEEADPNVMPDAQAVEQDVTAADRGQRWTALHACLTAWQAEARMAAGPGKQGVQKRVTCAAERSGEAVWLPRLRRLLAVCTPAAHVMQGGASRFTALHMATQLGVMSAVAELVEGRGRDAANVCDVWGRTPLHQAVLARHVQLFPFLAPVTRWQDAWRSAMSPLRLALSMVAAGKVDASLAASLLHHGYALYAPASAATTKSVGKKAETRSRMPRTELCYAVDKGCVAAVRAIWPWVRMEQEWNTSPNAFHRCVYRTNEPMLTTLLELGWPRGMQGPLQAWTAAQLVVGALGSVECKSGHKWIPGKPSKASDRGNTSWCLKALHHLWDAEHRPVVAEAYAEVVMAMCGNDGVGPSVVGSVVKFVLDVATEVGCVGAVLSVATEAGVPLRDVLIAYPEVAEVLVAHT